MFKFNELRMFPLLPSTTRLVETYNMQIRLSVPGAGFRTPEGVAKAASAVVATLMADGKVSLSELVALRNVKHHLQSDYRIEPNELAERQAAVNIYNAVEVDPDSRTARVVAPDLSAKEPR